MSGKKQHYIPQALLRGFGTLRNKKVYVQVFPYERVSFEVATDSIGAMRYFYSKPAESVGEVTLDDKITHYEASQAKILNQFRIQSANLLVDPSKAAELVTHLSIRNANFRYVTTDGVGRLFQEVTDIFKDKERTRRAMGLDGDKPSGVMVEKIDEMIEEHWDLFCQLGMTRDQMREWAWKEAKPLFEQNFGELAAGVAAVEEMMSPTLASVSKDAQIGALEKGMAPEARLKALEKFNWKLHERESDPFILSDCVAIALTKEGPISASLAGVEDTNLIIMPLNSDRLLVGSDIENPVVPDDINRIMAACGWDFFISASLDDFCAQLHGELRTIPTQVFQKLVLNVTSEYP